MRKLWGPLGWMTLHSISALYPHNPTSDDKNNLIIFMNLFKSTIVCPHCKEHFADMFKTYTKKYPNWSNSKLDLFVFVCRAHNTVNRRLDKPIIKTLEECIQTIKRNTSIISSKDYRTKYIDYITSSWHRDMGDTNLVQCIECRDLRKIINNYWDKLPQEVTFTVLPDIDITEHIGKETAHGLPVGYFNIDLGFLNIKNTIQTLPQKKTKPEIKENPPDSRLLTSGGPSGFRFQNGRLKLIGT
jgi:hypothetical protein